MQSYFLFRYCFKTLYKVSTFVVSFIRRQIKDYFSINLLNNINKYISVVLFNTHKTYYDYINSIIHEAEHIKQNMLYKYNVDDIGEPPAYTVGYVAMKMIMTFNRYNI